eukprot:GILK01009463.1.p1 GENE.GILK01009463.1~~GILK01009463.1.p1  ORF type:complete len:932 (-),score=224.61 GILK01009463.1:83-2848(-)
MADKNGRRRVSSDASVSDCQLDDEGFIEQAIPFITIDGSGKFQVSASAVDMLSRLRATKLCIVAIAGPMRSGKSFLLNRLLGRMKGFEVGGSVNACTKGIWMWGKPIHLDEETDVLLLDTEGLGSYDRSQSEDVRLFALSLLLSSLLIYNRIGHLDESALDEMAVMLHLTEHVRVSVESSVDNCQGLEEYMPSCLWVLRDFALDLSADGRHMTATEYLESALAPQQVSSEHTKYKNQIRRAISTFFRTRDCVTLVRPVTDEGQLQRLPTLPYEALRPEFRSQMDGLVTTVFRSVRPKMVRSRLLTGSMLVGLALEYVQALNGGAVPNILSAWDRVVAQQARRASEESFRCYQQEMRRQFPDPELPVEAEELAKAHEDVSDLCLNSFDVQISEESAALKQLRDDIKKRFKREYERLQEQNFMMSKAFCEDLIVKLLPPVKEPLTKLTDTNTTNTTVGSAGESSDESIVSSVVFEVKQQWLRLVQSYREQSRGPAKELVLSEFDSEFLMETFSSILQKQTRLSKQQSMELALRLNVAETQLKEVRVREADLRKENQEQHRAFLQQMEERERSIAQLKQVLEERVAAAERRATDLERSEQMKQWEFERTLNTKMAELQSADSKYNSNVNQVKQELRIAKQTISSLEAAVASKEKELNQVLMQFTAEKGALQQELEVLKVRSSDGRPSSVSEPPMAVNELYRAIKLSMDEILVATKNSQDKNLMSEYMSLSNLVLEQERKLSDSAIEMERIRSELTNRYETELQRLVQTQDQLIQTLNQTHDAKLQTLEHQNGELRLELDQLRDKESLQHLRIQTLEKKLKDSDSAFQGRHQRLVNLTRHIEALEDKTKKENDMKTETEFILGETKAKLAVAEREKEDLQRELSAVQHLSKFKSKKSFHRILSALPAADKERILNIFRDLDAQSN